MANAMIFQTYGSALISGVPLLLCLLLSLQISMYEDLTRLCDLDVGQNCSVQSFIIVNIESQHDERDAGQDLAHTMCLLLSAGLYGQE